MSGPSKCCWGIGRSIPPPGISGLPASIWRRSAARSPSCPVGSHPRPRRSNPMPPHATACPEAPARRQPGAPPWDVADILRLYGATYCRTHLVPPAQQQVMHAIAACRTAQLGGHAEHCPSCGCERYAYHACRNRPCPQCQPFTTVQWVEDRKAALLPVPYCHRVFTGPHDLNPLILAHQRPLFTLLCNAASQTLVQFGPRNLGGQIGCTMVLHTWDQTLGAHVHVHCFIAAWAVAGGGMRLFGAAARFLYP